MNTFDYEIQLIGLEEGLNENGFPIVEETIKEPILANKLSVRSNEFWQSKQAGVKLSLTFEIHSFEYGGEEKLRYDDEDYTIERTYDKGDLVELYCSRNSDTHES